MSAARINPWASLEAWPEKGGEAYREDAWTPRPRVLKDTPRHAQVRRNSKRLYDERMAAGLCRCGKPQAKGRRSCEGCLVRQRARAAERRECPKYRERSRLYHKQYKRRGRGKLSNARSESRPERMEAKREYMRSYVRRPEVRERRRDYKRARRAQGLK